MILDCSKYVGPCKCGRTHTLETEKVVVEYGATANFEQYMADVGLADKRRVVVWASMSKPIRRSFSPHRDFVPKISSLRR